MSSFELAIQISCTFLHSHPNTCFMQLADFSNHDNILFAINYHDAYF